METSDQSEVSIVIKLLERVELLEQELKNGARDSRSLCFWPETPHNPLQWL